MVLKFLPFLLLIVVSAKSQNSKQALRFASLNQAGMVTGDQRNSFVIQSVNGVKKENWFGGVGVGFDLYKDRTIPVFLSLRKDFTGKMNTPFVYADGGVSFLAISSNEKEWRNIASSSAGVYYDAGIGWKLKIKHDRAFVLSAGYSLKQVKYKVETFWGAPTIQLQEHNLDRYNFLHRRFVFKLGLQL